MKNKDANWFSINKAGSLIFNCANCREEFDLKIPFLDHDLGICPLCETECAFLDWKKRKIQIVMKNAPTEIFAVIQFIQKNLDELEYVGLIGSLEEIDDSINKKSD